VTAPDCAQSRRRQTRSQAWNPRPEVLTAHEIPANRLNYLRMLTAVSQAELDVREIENLERAKRCCAS